MFANYYGWWNNGGTAWVYQRSDNETGAWSDATTIVSFDDTSVDKGILGYFKPLEDNTGRTTVFMMRHREKTGVDDRLFYVTRGLTGWTAPVELDTPNRQHARAEHISVAHDQSGKNYLVYMKDSAAGLSAKYCFLTISKRVYRFILLIMVKTI